MTNLPVPVPATVSPGQLITGALFNAQVSNTATFLLSRPYFNGYQSTAQSIASGTWTAITLDTTTADTYSGHSNTTNPSRYVPQVAGWYLCLASIAWAGNVTGSRRVRVALNGSQVNPWTSSNADPTSGNSSAEMTVAFVYCNGTSDFIEVHAQQNSGGTLSTASGGGTLSVIWVSR